MDFGLAKAFAPEDDVSAETSQSPTLTRGTALGAILGTASYMSPEQARGKSVDKRTDIWAFGCCLYEARTGNKAFEGETMSDIIGAVMRAEPDWDALPTGGRALVKRCLVKDARRRLRDIGDARIELAESTIAGESDSETNARGSARTTLALVGVSALVLGAAMGAFLTRNERAPGGVTVTNVSLGIEPAETLGDRGVLDPVGSAAALSHTGLSRTAIALSPDGRHLVFTGVAVDVSQLYVRSLDASEARPLPGTEGAVNPFFSPDGAWVGYWATYDVSPKRTILDGPDAPTGIR